MGCLRPTTSICMEDERGPHSQRGEQSALPNSPPGQQVIGTPENRGTELRDSGLEICQGPIRGEQVEASTQILRNNPQ